MAMNKTLLRYWRSSRPLCLFVGERQRCGVELGLASCTLNCLVVFCYLLLALLLLLERDYFYAIVLRNNNMMKEIIEFFVVK